MKWRPHWGLTGPLIAIGDTHFPFADKNVLDWVYEQVERVQPAYVVQVGDLYDRLAQSRHPKFDPMSAQEEAERGFADASQMWSTINFLAPRAKKYQIRGNHDDRVVKRAMERAPELAPFLDLDKYMSFAGVKTVRESNDELFIGDVAVLHGYAKFGAHAAWNQCPTIVGHSHHGGVTFRQNRNGFYWELNCGFVGDLTNPAFAYRNQKHIHGWTLGLGVVDEHGPHFLLYPGASR